MAALPTPKIHTGPQVYDPSIISQGRPHPEIWTGPKRESFDTAATGALKERVDKPRLDLVPFEFIEGAARAFEYGATKYAEHNWRKGMKLSWLARSLMSHIFKWWMLGEDKDAESGLHHLDHAAACLAMVMTTLKEHPRMDDRYKKVTIGDNPDGRV